MTLNALAVACAEDSLLEVTCAAPSGNLLDLTTGFNYGSGDNGNVMSWAAVGQQTFNRSYTYDGVNRLYTMSAPGSTCSGLSWSYDQWGNRTRQTVTGGTCGSSQLTFNSYNHVTNSGFLYDAAGNMTHDASHSYTYDAENRITTVDGGATASYMYDALGRRAEKITGSTKLDYFYDLNGNVAIEPNSPCTPVCWATGYMYLGGQLFAEYTSSTTEFLSGDHLGSTRLLTNVSGGVVDNMDYLPFGEQIAGASATTHKFTGYERDAESNLDNAQARYNSPSLGRFMSPDPIGNFVADATNPQSWNMYAYALNNPLQYIDPTGTDPALFWLCVNETDDPSICGSHCGDGCIYSGPSAPNYPPPPPPPPDPNPPQLPAPPCSGGCVPTTGGGGSGGSGGTGTTNGSIISTIKGKVCSAIPQGRVTSLSYSLGLVGGETGSVSVVTNYSSGQVSGFATGGFQAGWNGVAAGSVSSGFIYGNLGSNNSGYSGNFVTGYGSGPVFGGYGTFGKGVAAFGPSAGANFTGGAGGGANFTKTTNPLQFGALVGSLFRTPLDDALAFAKGLVCH